MLTIPTTEDTENTGLGMEGVLDTKAIGCAIEVHRTLGPGLLESTRPMSGPGTDSTSSLPAQVPLRCRTKSVVDCDIVDVLVADERSELKAIEQLKGIHEGRF